MKTVCVYCGSSEKIDSVYLDAARQMGEALAGRGLQLIYGGGSTGLMGAVADSVLKSGGKVTGVITEQFNNPTLAHPNLTKMEVLPDMHTRKRRMADLADGFISLPGGLGTLDELFEILTWSQIGLHTKPIGLLNTNKYFDLLAAFLEQIQDEGFMYHERRELYYLADTPEVLLEKLFNYHPPKDLVRWVQRS
ncbi:MAG: TIGR00730 family Rossman fold protein [Chloroflexi bacterium]|nr:TIGR00730 family Rossman fold protein [Chloroflexota bacterium]